MLLFAHTGITLGLTLIWDKGLNRPFPITGIDRLSTYSSEIDYRLVLVGSMLPDIIDKPIGHFLFSETFDNNGRIIAHTLLFFLLLLGYGLFRFFHFHKTGILVLAICSGFHLVLDEIWRTPRTLFWPVTGWYFPETEYIYFTEWLKSIQKTASTDPIIYITETIGIIMLLFFGYYLMSRNRVGQFISKGKIQ